MNAFKQMMDSPNKPLGTWVMTGSPVVSDLLACAGYDFLVVDAEHGHASTQNLLAQIQAITSHPNVLPVLRFPGHDSVYIKQILDVVGVETLMFPMISNAAEAEKIVAACMYPPHGIRGFAKMIRASGFGMDAAYPLDAHKRLCIIAQLETEAALKEAISIGKVNGIDSVFIGPGDLAISMGISKGIADPELKETIANAVKACKKENIRIGTVMPTPELAKWFLQEGGSYVAIGGDLGMLMATATNALNEMNS